LFKKKKLQDVKISTVLGKDTEFKGTLIGKESIRIDGKLEGEVITEGDIFIGEESKISANLKGRNLINAGEIYGNIEAENKVEIVSSGKIFGNVKAESIYVEEGAFLKGEVETGKTEESENGKI
jgi:cytoskeletal protein CcmA (bactofilin family)